MVPICCNEKFPLWGVRTTLVSGDLEPNDTLFCSFIHLLKHVIIMVGLIEWWLEIGALYNFCFRELPLKMFLWPNSWALLLNIAVLWCTKCLWLFSLLSTWNGICGLLGAFQLVCTSPNTPPALLSNAYLLPWVFLTVPNYLGSSFVLSSSLTAIFEANLKTSVLKREGLTCSQCFL